MSEDLAIPAESIPGTAVVHIGDDHLVLVPANDGVDADSVLAQICSTPSVEELARRLRSNGDDPPPGFAMASWAGGTVRVLLRGDVAVQIYPLDGAPFQVEGRDLVTWCEQRFDGVQAVALLATATDLIDAAPTQTVQRRIHVAWVRVDTTSGSGSPAPQDGPSAPGPAQPHPHEPEKLSTPDSTAPEGSPIGPVQPVAAEPEQSLTAESEEGDQNAVPAVWPPPLPESGSDLATEMLDLLGTTTTTDALRDLSAQAPGPAPGPEGRTSDEPPTEVDPSSGPPPGDIAVPAVLASAPTPPPIAHTREFHETDEALAPPPEVSSPQAFAAPPRAGGLTPPPIDIPPPESVSNAPAVPAQPSNDALPQDGLISAVPGMAPPPPTPDPTPVTPRVALGGHQQADAAPPRPSQPPTSIPSPTAASPNPDHPPTPATPTASPAGGSTPAVQAVHCDLGHPNPAHSSSCRRCGGPISDRAIATIARPPMGWLVADDGSRVEIARPLLLGRNPSGVTHTPEGEPIDAIALQDLEQVLSRTHAEIRIVDWQVQVVDRDSRNGTFVTIPERPPFRLHPGDPYPIPIGSRISLGDSITFTYRAGVD